MPLIASKRASNIDLPTTRIGREQRLTLTEPSVLFEPWGLGDAVIAMASAMQDPDRLLLACNPRWVGILQAATRDGRLPRLIPVDVKHGTRAAAGQSLNTVKGFGREYQHTEVISIRGDPRDYLFARKLFPGSPIRMTGWVPFFAKRLAALDWPYRHGWLPVMNRYRAWAELAEVGFEKVEALYEWNPLGSRTIRVGIHVGAQWRSRQYPQVAELMKRLQGVCEVVILAGPTDPLPESIREDQVIRLVNESIVHEFRRCTHVIANDSGPMHLAAFLGCRVVAVARHIGLGQWLPPKAIAVEAPGASAGYRPERMASYLSDDICSGWPSVDAILEAFQGSL